MPDVIRVVSRRLAQPSQDRTVMFSLSSDLQDRAGDSVKQAGWQLQRYSENPVILWGHNHAIPAIGRMTRLGIDGAELVGAVTFATAEQHPFADTVFRLVDGGFINAGSVGFIPHKWEIRSDGGVDFLEQELLEYSVVNVPMNPDALARAVVSGIDITPLAKAAGAENAGSYAELRAKLLASNTAPQSSTPSLAMLRNRAANLTLRAKLR